MKKIDFKKLNTKRLLSYYKSERQKSFNLICSCGCYEPRIGSEEKFELHKQYLSEIKKELDSRENIKRK